MQHKLQKINFDNKFLRRKGTNLRKWAYRSVQNLKRLQKCSDQKRQNFFGMFRDGKLIRIDLITLNIVTMLEIYSKCQKNFSKSRDIASDEK